LEFSIRCDGAGNDVAHLVANAAVIVKSGGLSISWFFRMLLHRFASRTGAMAFWK
jgi:hypothetical protein